MKPVESIAIEPKYKRENGVAVLDIRRLPLPEGFEADGASAILLPAGQVAGNHRHPRREAYFCLSKGVELHWIDGAGKTHVEQMMTDEGTRLFVMPQHVPHAVINTSGSDVTLIGCGDGPLEDVEPVEVVKAKVEVGAGLSDSEVNQVAKLLSKLEPGFLPFDIFHEVARLVTLPIIEVVPLRRSAGDKVEVLLLAREDDDPAWPDMLHVPGTVVRASDSLESAMKRIVDGELGGVSNRDPVYVENIIHKQARGAEVSQVFWLEMTGDQAEGQFYDAEALPDTMVETQRGFVADAVRHFRDEAR